MGTLYGKLIVAALIVLLLVGIFFAGFYAGGHPQLTPKKNPAD